MRNDKWIFYTDLFGRQRWERFDRSGMTLAESATGFATLSDAMVDASLCGYVPGVGSASACSFEWRCEEITMVADCEKVIA